jgi:hypothetical protein
MDNTINYTSPEEEFGQTIEGFGAVVGRTKQGHRLIVADTGVWVSDEDKVLFEYNYLDREGNLTTLSDEEIVNLVTRIVNDESEVSIESIEKELFPSINIKPKDDNGPRGAE